MLLFRQFEVPSSISQTFKFDTDVYTYISLCSMLAEVLEVDAPLIPLDAEGHEVNFNKMPSSDSDSIHSTGKAICEIMHVI